MQSCRLTSADDYYLVLHYTGCIKHDREEQSFLIDRIINVGVGRFQAEAVFVTQVQQSQGCTPVGATFSGVS